MVTVRELLSHNVPALFEIYWVNNKGKIKPVILHENHPYHRPPAGIVKRQGVVFLATVENWLRKKSKRAGRRVEWVNQKSLEAGEWEFRSLTEAFSHLG